MIAIEDVQDWLRLARGTEDDVLTREAASAVAFLEGESGAYLGAPREFAEVRDGTGGRRLLVDHPILTVEQVRIRCRPGAEWVTLAAETDYEFRGRQLIRVDGLGWPRGLATVDLVYTAGMAEDAAPAWLRDAVQTLVLAKLGTRGREALKSARFGDLSYTLADVHDLPGVASAIRQLTAAQL